MIGACVGSADLLSHTHCADYLSCAIHSLTFQTRHSEPPLPDPIKLLRRIHALETSVQSLQQDCQNMMERRRRAVLEATDQLTALRHLYDSEVR